jgi:hypothetical protein
MEELLNSQIMNTRLFNGHIKGLASKMDIVILKENKMIRNNPHNRTIFINTRDKNGNSIVFFYEYLFKQLNNKKINLVIAGEDWTFPRSIDKRMSRTPKYKLDIFAEIINHPNINKIYVENLDMNINPQKVIPIPLGINPKEGPINFRYFNKHFSTNKILKVTNLNRDRSGKGQWLERGHVRRLCNSSWSNVFVKVNENFDQNKYLKILSKYAFTLCIHGGGLDPCPKLFEAIICGVIPIIKECKPLTDVFLDLPVVIVKKWTPGTLNPRNLKILLNKYKKFHLDKNLRYETLKKLSLNYWVEKINNID